MNRILITFLFLWLSALCTAQNCGRSSGSPMQMQVLLSMASAPAEPTEATGVPRVDGDSSRHAATEEQGQFTPEMQIRVELQDSFGSTLRESSPNGEGKVVFMVCSRNIYKLRVTGSSIEEQTAENIAPGQGDSTVNLTLYRKGKNQEKTKGKNQTVAANRLKIPHSAQKELERGDAALSAGKLGEARRHFEAAIAKYPEFDQAYNNLGVVLMETGEKAKGRAAFEKAVQINGHFARALTNLARIALDEKRFAEAYELSKRSLSSEPLNVKSLFVGVEAAYFSNRYEDAVAYSRTLHGLPHSGMGLAHYLCAKSLEKENLPQQAVAEYYLFVSEDPKDPNVPLAQMAIAELTTPAAVHQ